MKGFAHAPEGRFLAAVDPFKSRREGHAKYLNGVYKDEQAVEATGDWRGVLARPDIDAVVLCTCDHWHVPLAIAATAAGKDVYVEKPLSLSLAWAKRLREVATRQGRVVQYGTQQRSGGAFRHVCQLVRNGYIGAVKHIDAWCVDGTRAVEWMQPSSTVPEPVPADFDYDMWLGPAPEAAYNHFRVHREGSFHNYQYSIGFLGGWGAHPLDIAQWGLNTDHTGPTECEAVGTIPTQGLYSTVCEYDARYRYANGVTLRLMTDKIAAGVVTYRKRMQDHGTTFHGAEGWISVDRSGMEASDPRLLTLKFRPSDERLTVSPGHDRNFLECVRTRQQPVSHLEAAIRSDTISHLADISVRLGRKLAWDPGKEQFVGDDQANRMLNRPMRPPYLF